MGVFLMRVVAKSTLVKFWCQPECADSKGALQSWFDEAIKASWKTPQNIKEQYSSASICGNNRVVFNIAGNKYRLVVELSLIHISEPTRLGMISYAVFCLK